MMKLIFISIFFCSLSFAAEPTLTITSNDQTKVFKRSELLKNKETRKITIPADGSYPGGPVTYQAIPAKFLFKSVKVPSGATLLFKCLDGFSAPLSADRLLSTAAETATPYIAIEPPTKKWTNLKGKDASAGPFYLVWLNPQKSKIGPEEWPYQLAGFEVKSSIESEFPRLVPDSRLSVDHEVRKGFQIFAKNCFACHTLNGEGHAQMGPDLNLPHNPTEYLNSGYLKKLIRDPQSLRQWPQSKMSAFPESVLSNTELDHLISYLEHMSKRKK